MVFGADRVSARGVVESRAASKLAERKRKLVWSLMLTNVVNLVRNRCVGPIDHQGVDCHMLAG